MWDLCVSYASQGGITFLVCMCLFCVVLVVLFRARQNWVMVHDSTQIYVGFVEWCDIHSKSLSMFRGCVLPFDLCAWLSCSIWTYFCIWEYDIIAFCIVFVLVLFLVLCINFISKLFQCSSSCDKIDSFGSVTGFLCTCEVCLICTFYSHLCNVLYLG